MSDRLWCVTASDHVVPKPLHISDPRSQEFMRLLRLGNPDKPDEGIHTLPVSTTSPGTGMSMKPPFVEIRNRKTKLPNPPLN
jgi:hypothetical protein